MKKTVSYLGIFLLLIRPSLAMASLSVGIGKSNITPPVGTPSAGYTERKGVRIQEVHDPLLAIALLIDNGDKKIVFCSVDHLGFTYEMVQEVVEQIHAYSGLEKHEIFIASSHTHSGGGAYLNIPFLGEALAGAYSRDITQFYIEKTRDAILQACHHPIPAKIGIGYGKAEKLSKYRGLWPKDITPLSDVMIIKITHLNDTPLAVFFNYPVHPTILTSQNLLFSADFVGYARDRIQSSIGPHVQPIYFNGAQGDILPHIFDEEERFHACDFFAKSLADTVKTIWETTPTVDTLQIATQKQSYSFKPQSTPFGLTLPVETYQSEMNVIVFDQLHACITMPGELSCVYDKHLKEIGRQLGFPHVSIFGLTNDAHGYIILPEAWQHKTYESGLSFGGEFYGEVMKSRAVDLLHSLAN